jgi:predicted dehydrogenase
MRMWAISPRVNSPKNDDPSLWEPLRSESAKLRQKHLNSCLKSLQSREKPVVAIDRSGVHSVSLTWQTIAGLVSGNPTKAAAVATLYGVPAKSVYNYQHYELMRENPEIDAVYVVLPNALHAKYTIRAAQAGKHVLCEKPMAVSSQKCEQMIAACKMAERKLMIAYRIQYEPYNRIVQSYVRSEKFGRVSLVESVNAQNQGDPNQWRQKRALAGGGSLPDVGLYCLNTTRFLLGEEPTEVSAFIHNPPNDPRFREVEDAVLWQMVFPSGTLASCASSYGSHRSRRYRVYGETGWIGMDPAFSYDNLQTETSSARGETESRSHLKLSPKNQFALEMDHFGECVANQALNTVEDDIQL